MNTRPNLSGIPEANAPKGPGGFRPLGLDGLQTGCYRLLSGLALVFMTVFMLAFASEQPFWLDELYSIGIVHNADAISICRETLLGDVHPPLFYLMVSLFYRVMPYGEPYLLLLPIAFTIGGIVALSKTGKVLGGEDLGFFVLCVAVTSSILQRQGGWELRSYSMLFCFSSVTLLCYVKRLKEETNRNIVFYGLSLTLLLYTHYFGAILAFFYGLMDLYSWLRKKIAFKCILSYLLAGFFFVPWLVLVLIYNSRDVLDSFWPYPPKAAAPILSVAYLLSNSLICCFFFGVGALRILFGERRKSEEKRDAVALSVWRRLFGCILWVIATVFCYSKFINPRGGMYVDRYFFVVLPHVFLVTAYAAAVMCDALKHKSAFLRESFRCFLLLLLLTVGVRNYYLSIIQSSDPSREIAEFLSQDEKARSRDSLTIIADQGLFTKGWLAYYFEKRGYETPPNTVFFPERKSGSGELGAGGKTPLQPLTAKRLLEYSRLYVLFDGLEEEFPSELLDVIERNYVLEETLFPLQPPKRPTPGFMRARTELIEALKKVLLPAAPAAASAGSAGRLKVYSKRRL
jgi:uncharacterized membrane protein